MPKTLVISRYFPPAIGGTPTVLKNLFRVFAPEDFFVLCAAARSPETSEFSYQARIVDFPLSWRRSFRRLLIPLYLFLMPAIWYQLRRIKKTWRPSQVLVIYPDPFFAVAGYLFACWAGLPYVLYFHDLFEEAQIKPSRVIQRLLAGIFEKRMIQGSEKFLVVSEGLRDFYEAKYGAKSVVVPHSIDPGIVQASPSVERTAPGPVKIVYTGGVYDNQRDALVTFVRALHAAHFSFTLTIVSRMPRKCFDDLGILGSDDNVVFLKDRREVFELQRQADMLYLPLAFRSPSPWEVKTSIPTKFFEYAASMRPVFVHCPPDSSLARFCREKEIGEVCVSEDRQAILAAVKKILGAGVDVAKHRRFLESYDRNKIGAEFRALLGYVTPGGMGA